MEGNASSIRAGSAYVELLLKDKDFQDGLKRASDRLKAWGRSVAIVGGVVLAAGAAITVPLLAMVKGIKKAADDGISIDHVVRLMDIYIESYDDDPADFWKNGPQSDD
jgi:hypothetical protein